MKQILPIVVCTICAVILGGAFIGALKIVADRPVVSGQPITPEEAQLIRDFRSGNHSSVIQIDGVAMTEQELRWVKAIRKTRATADELIERNPELPQLLASIQKGPWNGDEVHEEGNP